MEGTGEIAGQKKKAYVAAEGLMKNARKTRRVEEHHQASPNATRWSDMFTCRSLGDKFTNYVKLSDLIELRTMQGSLVRMHSPDKQGSLIRRPSLGKRSSLIRKSSQTFPLVM
ncbi:hypothetical protein Fot_35376 [Forsythia ovata]|uniref:Uncharacterized protein n=1 Tax=Forsythia ovata TaxID=205694 RepID=A0ABD1SLC8_9LAMI